MLDLSTYQHLLAILFDGACQAKIDGITITPEMLTASLSTEAKALLARGSDTPDLTLIPGYVRKE